MKIGSILSNVLLVLGCSFIAGGFKFKESTFQATAAQTSSSLLVLTTATLIIPAAYHASRLDGPETILDKVGDSLSGLLVISRGTSIVSIHKKDSIRKT